MLTHLTGSRSTLRAAATAVLLLVLAIASTACEAAAGESRRGPEPFRPTGDTLATGVAEISFPWSAPPGSPGAIGEIVQTSGSAEADAVTLRISAGGTGVSLRSDCADGARAGGAWVDGTSVDVTEYGSGRCESWSRVTTGSASSWVRDEYLEGLPPPDKRTTPGVSSVSPGDPTIAQLRVWTNHLLDGAGRIALLSRHSSESTQRAFTLQSLEEVQNDMRALATEIGAAAAAPTPACQAPRRPMTEAATAIGELGKQLHAGFEGAPEEAAGLATLANRYLAAQKEAARLIADCARR